MDGEARVEWGSVGVGGRQKDAWLSANLHYSQPAS